jgi:hypothetical protein
MNDDQLTRLFRTLDEPAEPDQGFADALFARLDWKAHRRRRPVGWVLMAAALLLAAAVASAVSVGSGRLTLPFVLVVPPPSPPAPASPQATSSSTASPAPTLGFTELGAPIRAGWTPYTSSQAGFTFGYPSDWTVEPAERAYDLDTDASDPLSRAMDDFIAPTGDVRVSVFSVPLDEETYGTDNDWGIDLEAWIQDYCEKTGSSSSTCAGILIGAVPLCREVRDCHPGLLVGVSPPWGRDVQAFFSGPDINERITVVTIWRAGNDPSLLPYGGARRLIEDFLVTMCVSPETPRGAFPCG